MKLQVRAPGKLILLGEYVVLEGAPALVAAVDRFARVSFQPSPESCWLFSAQELNIQALRFQLAPGGPLRFLNAMPEQRDKLHVLEAVLSALATRCTRSIPPAAVEVDTGGFYLPGGGIKLGLGSSAAVTVALMVAGARWMHLSLDDEEAFNMAWTTHRRAQHNVGSGIDVAASFFGGLLQYTLANQTGEATPEIHRLTWPVEGLCWLPVWAGRATSTPDMVKRFRQFASDHPRRFQHHLRNLSRASARGCQALRQNDVSRFLAAVKQFFNSLIHLTEDSGIPIVSPVHQTVAQLVHQCGGVYKPSGAGGGDMGVAFFAEWKHRQAAADTLKQAGLQTLELSVETNGVVIETLEA